MEAHSAELVRLDTPSERTAQLRGHIAAYVEMGRILEDIVSATERMEDATRQREQPDRPVNRISRTWGSPYRE